MSHPKTPSSSRCVMNELVLPNDTNTLGNLMGGRLLHFMDICAAIAAQRHSNRTVVTASVDSVDFRGAIKLGEVVVLEAVVTRAFTTSMEVSIEVWAEDNATGERRHSNRAFYTFVAVDQSGRPIPVVALEPDTDQERERFEAAGRRRQLRLVLAGRLALEDADELRDHLREIALEPPPTEGAE
ncbi:acyl-CoA thioesterase [Rubrivirga sp.]|uniref:acyl-CoA thioesterase n=1 Tax=Rubrivirga sp. TaxID=1885344 RepID=UPI003C70C6F8